MYEIAKQFDFCYGHRVWNQELKEQYSLDSSCACRHLHGHQGTIIIYLQARELEKGMVTDFKHLNWFKKWLDETLDHKFIMDMNDPLRHFEVPAAHNVEFIFNPGFNYFYLQRLEHLPKYLIEKYEGLVFVPFVPTSENICKWFYDIVQKKMKPLSIKVSRIQFFETPKSQSNYIP